MKKYFQGVLFFFIGLIFFACPSVTDNRSGKESPLEIKTGKVRFINHTMYDVIIHNDYINGMILLELKAGETSEELDVRINDNPSAESTFSIEYLHRVPGAFNTASGEIYASMIDPNVQLKWVIEEKKLYTIRIPRPTNLEPRSAFLEILNLHTIPFELRYLSNALQQEGNGKFHVALGEMGIYKLKDIPTEGKLFQGYQVVATFVNTSVPDFTAKNGMIYSFDYDGTSVKLNEKRTRPFVF
jgi:hypothetical protein